ncbi:MAG: alpha/beta hydrolase family protein [Bryobacteraceae bacterium]|nr:alpha/beta hydrolase family protein [Bryobacteraceae bacterium]
MLGLYAKWIDKWEYELATADTNRVVRPFEWGLDWLEGAAKNGNPAKDAREYLTRAAERSQEFFSYETPRDFRLNGSHLTFTSALASKYPENNTVHADFFPAQRGPKRAVVVLPQWNSDVNGHVGLCKLLNRFGVTALRMSMAYHDRRMPPELQRADYHVSSNVGRTVHASRQSVMDARSCLDWLQEQGYERLGILGTSLGSCVAFITAAHDERVRAGVFNHVSMYFSDVVWTGLSTQHVKRGFETDITQDDLRAFWGVISPATYLPRMAGRTMKFLLIWAKYDTTFLPVYSKQVLESFKQLKLDHEVFTLPCAHYTTGRFPFNLMDGLTMCRFLDRKL